MTEAFAFSAGVFLYSWVLRGVWPPLGLLLVFAMAISFWRHRETVDSLGLGYRAFLSAMHRWRLWWLLTAALVAWVVLGRQDAAVLLGSGLRYGFWCILQQLAYQNMIYKRIANSIGRTWKARAIAATLFSAVHIPNPVLMPATLVWGYWSSYLFEQIPSVPALGVAQFLLSGALLRLTPANWSRGFRAGPGYFEFLTGGR